MNAAPMTPESLEALLDASPPKLTSVDIAMFGRWLEARIREQEWNEVFRQKRSIAELVSRHNERLRRARADVEAARVAWERCDRRDEYERLAQQVHRLERAVDGLAAAVARNDADPAKLASFRASLARTRGEQSALIERCEEKRNIDLTHAKWNALRDEIGLTQAEETLCRLQHERGRRADSTGKRFEERAASALQDVLPDWLPGSIRERILLTGVTLGAARTEFDLLVVEPSEDREAVDVVALVEAKRNIDDLVGGFTMRQTNLTWLTGDAARYDPADWRTQSFPTGHFDRPVAHAQHGRRWLFDRASFRRFQRDAETGHYLEGLWFVTAPRPLLGVTSAELSRIMHWAASESDLGLAGGERMNRFVERVIKSIDRFQTRDVLEIYLRRERARQIIGVS